MFYWTPDRQTDKRLACADVFSSSSSSSIAVLPSIELNEKKKIIASPPDLMVYVYPVYPPMAPILIFDSMDYQ